MNDHAPNLAILPTALTDSAPVAIYHYSGPGRPLYANPAFRAMFGVEAAQNIDVWVMKIHPDDRARAREEWARFEAQLESGVDEFRTQYRILGSAGEPRVVMERLVRAVGVDGFVGTITDVTELVQTQTESARAASDRPRQDRGDAAGAGVGPERFHGHRERKRTPRISAAAIHRSAVRQGNRAAGAGAAG